MQQWLKCSIVLLIVMLAACKRPCDACQFVVPPEQPGDITDA